MDHSEERSLLWLWRGSKWLYTCYLACANERSECEVRRRYMYVARAVPYFMSTSKEGMLISMGIECIDPLFTLRNKQHNKIDILILWAYVFSLKISLKAANQ